ncbi:MAG: M23 family metallopeptidase, partial [Pseudomonadales bacterium]
NPVGQAGYQPPAYIDLLDRLAHDIEDREQQLGVLETLLAKRKMDRDVFIAGRPVKKGWLSSRFGHRSDPISGNRAWHEGVDFAGKDGADVISVAAGVVVYADVRSGYGKMVEINHGGGYSTRYGHHKDLKVKSGDIVRKGEVIGQMGSSGRSTGPHVHFEVFKNGRVVDPSTYIHRASR